MYGMLKKVFGGAMLAGLALGATAQAGVVLDIRDSALQTNNLTVTPAMLTEDQGFGAGARLLEIWVTVSGTNSTWKNWGTTINKKWSADDGVQYITGAVVSEKVSGNLNGDSLFSARNSPFDATGSNDGPVNAYNADGIDDIGPLGGFSADITNYLYARSASMYTGAVFTTSSAPAGAPATVQALMGYVVYQLNDANPGTTKLNWIWQESSPGTINSIAASFLIDNVSYNLSPSGVSALPSGALTLTPMTFSVAAVPEPASLGLLGLAGLGLLARRRA